MNPHQPTWDRRGNSRQLTQDARSGDGVPLATSAATGASAIGAAGPSAGASMAAVMAVGLHPTAHGGGWNGCPLVGAWHGMLDTGRAPPV